MLFTTCFLNLVSTALQNYGQEGASLLQRCTNRRIKKVVLLLLIGTETNAEK